MSGHTIIDLNDAGVRIATAAGEIHSSPACAFAVRGEILLGAAAAAVALVHPRDVNDRFWQRLDQQPLRRAGQPWRHHADIAFQHLAHVLELGGKPESATLVVPGGYDNDQLALLLGIAAACGVEVQALVDAAVAAAADGPESGTLTFVDLELHRTTITTLEKSEQVTRTAVASVEQTGLKRLLTTCVAHIADCFLAQSRFDPLHLAATEQELHEQLHGWLGALSDLPELRVHIDHNRTRFEAVIERRQLIESIRPMLSALRDRVGGTVVLSHRFGLLPGIEELLPDARVVAADAIFDSCRATTGWLQPDANGRVPLTLTLEARAGTAAALPVRPKAGPGCTHVLVGSVAVPVGPKPLFVDQSGMPKSSGSDQAMAVLAREDAAMTVTPTTAGSITVNGQAIDGATALNPGDRLSSSRWPADLVAIQVRADAP